VNDIQEASCDNQIYKDSSGKTDDKNFFPNKTKHSIYDSTTHLSQSTSAVNGSCQFKQQRLLPLQDAK
jgi:hypothetical protein